MKQTQLSCNSRKRIAMTHKQQKIEKKNDTNPIFHHASPNINESPSTFPSFHDLQNDITLWYLWQKRGNLIDVEV